MTLRHPARRVYAGVAFVAAALSAISSATHAADGQWSNPAGGFWSDPNNWLSQTIADGGVADFSMLPLAADATVHLDSPRSIHTFFIADTAAAHNWHFDNNNSANNTLTLAGPTAANFSVGNGSAFFDLTLTGAAGLFKDGPGALVIQQPATYAGKTLMFFGQIVSGVDNALPTTTDLQVVALTAFDLNGHNQQLASFSGVGTVTNSGGTPALLSVSSNGALSEQTHLTGNLAFTFAGGGNLTLQTPAIYTGGTTIDNATLTSGITDALPATSSLTLANNATFDLNGHQQDFTAIFGAAGTVTNSALGLAADLVVSPFTTNTIVTPITGNLNFNKESNTLLFIATTPTYIGLTSIDAGTLFFNANASLHNVDGVGNLTIGAGISLTSDSIQLPTVHVIAGGTYTIRPNGANLNGSFLRTLTLDGAADAWTSTFDLTNNKLLLAPSANRASTLADIRNQALFGRTHTTGLRASGLPANEVLAVIDNAIAGKTAFAGMSANANSILIGPELLGDTNIDGTVDRTDLSTILNNFGAALPDWSSGNFDGQPTIDLTDLSAVLNNFGLSIPGPSSTVATPTSVPEPAPLALLVASIGVVISKRRSSVKFASLPLSRTR